MWPKSMRSHNQLSSGHGMSFSCPELSRRIFTSRYGELCENPVISLLAKIGDGLREGTWGIGDGADVKY